MWMTPATWPDTYRTQDPTIAEYAVFSNAQKMPTKVGHILDCKTNLTFQKHDISQNMLFEKNRIKLKCIVQLLLKIRFYIFTECKL